MAHEIITLAGDGAIGTEMHGFKGKACLKVAEEIARELEALGVVTDVAGIQMTDTGGQLVEDETATLKVTGS